jgi:hypothetical protein
MGGDGLRTAIEHVDRELAAASLDPATRDRIRAALEELHAALEEGQATGGRHRDTFVELVEHFAEDHPALSAALGRVAHALSSLGI